MEIMDVMGKSGAKYSFVKIGKAFIADEPLKAKFNGKELRDWKLKLKLFDENEEILNAEQSSYLVLDGKKIIYVGYYSNSLRDRWWKKKGYFWHGDVVDNGVNNLFKENCNKDISLWISIDPYAYTKDGIKINISKFIEDDIIMSINQNQLLNKVGINLALDKKTTKPVSEILKINS